MLSLARLAEVLDVDYVWLLAGDPAKVKWKERENVEV